MRTRPPQRIDEIRPGYYRVRKVRNGPWIAAEITVQDGMILISEDGAGAALGVSSAMYEDLIVESITEGQAFSHPLLRCAWFGEPIDEAEYRHLIALGAWARQHRPSHPAAQPDRPIDRNTVPISDIF